MTEYVRKCSEYQKQKMITFKELGLCKCGNKALPDKRSCQICLDKSRKWYQEHGKERYKTKRSYREQNGLCLTCGKPTDGKTCNRCLEKNKIRYVNFYGEKRTIIS